MRLSIGLLVLLVLAGSVHAQGLERQARQLEGKLMAPCCMANPVSEHHSPVANEMRRDIRRMLSEGRTERQILDFYVEKYGEQILALPRASGFNLVSYFLPVVFLIVGATAVLLWIRRAVAAGTAEPSTAPGVPNGEYAERLRRELEKLD